MPKKKSKPMFKIYACAVDYQYIYTFCPNPKCRQQIHIYRSNGDLSNREFKYTNHCYMVDSSEHIQLCIVPATKRSSVTHYRNGSFIFSDRKFKNTHPDNINININIKNAEKNPLQPTVTRKKKKLVVKFD